jgi:hypothetical protein
MRNLLGKQNCLATPIFTKKSLWKQLKFYWMKPTLGTVVEKPWSRAAVPNFFDEWAFLEA